MIQIYEQFRSIQNYWVHPDWLSGRMLFLSGPRQVGKTTLVTSTLCPTPESYLNWDSRSVRLSYQKDPDFFSGSQSRWLCFDEIHKRSHWKDILKGIYDTYKSRYRFVITGSARLDTFKKSGDSLVGRYFHTHLFPLNLADFHKRDFVFPQNLEKCLLEAADLKDSPHFQSLLDFGGFPEPYFSGKESFWKRWSSLHRDLILGEDLRDLTKIVEIDKIALLLEYLQPSIGSTLSHLNLARDLETSHPSIKRWLNALSKVQLVFPISPYSKNIKRAFKQEQKWFYMDWRAAESNRFENYVACSLFRAATLWTDRFGDKITLHFVRTHDGAEVDFLLCKNQKPWFLVEAKKGQAELNSALYRFSAELKVPCVLVTSRKNFFKKVEGDLKQKIYCISWAKFGQMLP